MHNQMWKQRSCYAQCHMQLKFFRAEQVTYKKIVCVFVHRGAAVNGEIPLAHFNPIFHNPQGLNKCTNIIYCNAPSLGGFSP